MLLSDNISKILSSLKLLLKQFKPLLYAVMISLLLHAFVVSKFTLSLPELDDERQTIQMHLVSLPPEKTAEPAAIKEKLPTPEPAHELIPEPTPAAQIKSVEPAPLLEVPSATSDPIIEVPATTADMPGSTSLDKEPTPTPSIQTEAEESALAAELEDAIKEPMHLAYSYVETDFEVFRGTNTSAAGVAKITYSAEENGSYIINSTTEAKGMASLFFGSLVQKSEGLVTKNGLVPNSFTYQYGNDEKKLQSAKFAWADGVIHMHSSKGDSTESLVAGTQDLLSFMYQFMFIPPLASMQITMTNGKKLRTYTYSFVGEEFTHTKLGELKTIHLLKGDDEIEKTEIWLALDYQYLPVKIRKTEKDGSIIEQVATKISTD